jgi:hypothetical protein
MPLVFDDVVTGISRFTAVDDAFMNKGRLVPLGAMLGMNRGLSLLLGGLHRLLRGKLALPRGGTLGLLHGSDLEESSNFITGPMGLRVRWLGHVTKEHGGCDNILAITSSLSSSSAVCACRALVLEGLLK